MSEHEEDGFSHHCPKCNHHNPTMCAMTGIAKGLRKQVADRDLELARLRDAIKAARREALQEAIAVAKSYSAYTKAFGENVTALLYDRGNENAKRGIAYALQALVDAEAPDAAK